MDEKVGERTSRRSKRLFYIRPSTSFNSYVDKSNEYNLPLCLHCIDYEKVFDIWKDFVNFQALRKTNINDSDVKLLQTIYSQATARVHLDHLVSDKFPTYGETWHGDPISPNSFTNVKEEIFKKVYISEGINIDGEYFAKLRFDDEKKRKKSRNTFKLSILRNSETWIRIQK